MKLLYHSVSIPHQTFYHNLEGKEPERLGTDTERMEIKKECKEKCETLSDEVKHSTRILTGKEYAAKKDITLEQPLGQDKFDKAWEARLAAQKKEGFTGMEVPEGIKNEVWDQLQHTFEAKGLTGDKLDAAMAKAIEAEVLFRKTAALDEVPRDADGKPLHTFPDGSHSEGDYIDSLAMGDPETDEDNIDPALIAYLRATNALGFGREADQGKGPGKLGEQAKAVVDQLRALNIKDMNSFKANIGKYLNPESPEVKAAAAAGINTEALSTGNEADSQKPLNLLQKLIEMLVKLAKGQSLSPEDYGNSRDRHAGDKNVPRHTGEAVASNQFLNQLLENNDLPPERKALLQAAAGDLGKGENDRALMDACSRAGGMRAGPNAWCMMWVQKILGQIGNGNQRKTAWARDGLAMGTPTQNPKPGDLVIVARGDGGHIGFFLGFDKGGKPIIIGGNQKGDVVSVKTERRPLLGYRSVV